MADINNYGFALVEGNPLNPTRTRLSDTAANKAFELADIEAKRGACTIKAAVDRTVQMGITSGSTLYGVVTKVSPDFTVANSQNVPNFVEVQIRGEVEVKYDTGNAPAAGDRVAANEAGEVVKAPAVADPGAGFVFTKAVCVSKDTVAGTVIVDLG